MVRCRLHLDRKNEKNDVAVDIEELLVVTCIPFMYLAIGTSAGLCFEFLEI